MQGLAVADFLTVFSTYGLQLLFNSQYECLLDYMDPCYQKNLPYPYCFMAHHLSLTSFTFHTVSYTITTCLGIQKVIAIRFPIWTRNQLTNKKAVFCCAGCFLFSIIISFSRHFNFAFKRSGNKCELSSNFLDGVDIFAKVDALAEYSSGYYLMIQTFLVTFCCLFMLLSTVFILYKLSTNKFRGRMTEQRKQEKRSVIMVIIVLVVFLVTEVPKVCLYIWWVYLYTLMNAYPDIKNSMSFQLLLNYEQEMAMLLFLHTDMFSGDGFSRLNKCLYLMEGVKLFTIVGCLSNFIIYIIMSTKMRNEISLIFTRRTYNRTDEIGKTQTQIPRNRHTNQIEMDLIQETGNHRTHDIKMNLIQETGNRRTNEIEINLIQETGNRCTNEIEINLIQETGNRCTNEIEINLTQETGNRRTNEIEMNLIQETGNRRLNEIDMDLIQETGNHRTDDKNKDYDTRNWNPSCTHDKEMNFVQETGNHRTDDKEMNLIQETGNHRTDAQKQGL
ncbi:unnamed protein product [Mytilus coruscus]|uniref:G-protein coupled receptors family 1 profile domain-containing protein n=1 Tax=Mytilus coruscus TaxID=42192 RepID=A0A6J8D8M1_MYTCO|nr:unnamed protein product [Mytilus coruscus]